MRREQVERCLATTMTIKDWCALNGVAESTMYGWMARFRKEEPELFDKPNASQWIELSREAIAAQTALAETPKAVPTPPAAVRDAADGLGNPAAPPIIVHVNGADVAVPPGSAESDVASVLRAVVTL